ncbi:MAG: hypothetical protein JST68_25580 [Bacteroidetes bacterium]|nr:hypothetical protein [Bacteroidota bacterium]
MKRNSFYVDKITRSIEEAITKKNIETEVLSLEAGDLKGVTKRNGWRFNWRIERAFKERELYKLVIKGDKTVQGLLSLQRAENYIEMHLIEAAPHNFGSNKKYLGVAGNLVAFACKISFGAGFDGVVAFRAKTRLIQHYKDSLGAELLFRDRMCVRGDSAKKLVNSYFKDVLK